MRVKNWMFLTIFFLLLSSCNLMATSETPAVEGAKGPGVEVTMTSLAKTTEPASQAVATATDLPTSAPTETPRPSATPSPSVTPSPSFTLSPTPQAAATSATSLPKPRTGIDSSISVSDVIMPDLVASDLRWSPNQVRKNQPITILVKVTNRGNDSADQFTVVWLSDSNKPGCDWLVSELAAGESVTLDCEFTYSREDYQDAAFVFVTVKVDTENAVTESNESKDSNSYYGQITFRK